MYYNYEGVGVTNNRLYSYSQAVRVGNIIKCSGQGGWDDQGNIDEKNLKGQVELAFKNVEKNIQSAGGKGWGDAYSVKSFHISLSSSFDLMVEAFRKWMPNHQPTWTCVGVTELGIPGMIVEIEVEALLSEKGRLRPLLLDKIYRPREHDALGLDMRWHSRSLHTDYFPQLTIKHDRLRHILPQSWEEECSC